MENGIPYPLPEKEKRHIAPDYQSGQLYRDKQRRVAQVITVYRNVVCHTYHGKKSGSIKYRQDGAKFHVTNLHVLFHLSSHGLIHDASQSYPILS